MQNKLQELTDKLYNEGLSKGKQEAEEMKSKAKAEAAAIISEAKNDAAKIVADAQKEAEELKSKVENDLKMASSQTISAVRQRVEEMITLKALSSPVKTALTETEFLKTVILTIVKAFNAANAEPVALEAILPASMESSLKDFISNEAQKEMTAGITFTFSKQIQGGFKIGPKEGGFMISFADGDFQKMLADYLRPSTKKLLFGC